MNREQLQTKSTEELLRLAEERHIEVAGEMGHDALVEALLSHSGGRSPESLSAPAGDQLVEEAKYYVGPPHEAAEEERGIPEGYGRTTIVLQARDPDWAHSYWEVAAADRSRAEAIISDSWGMARRVLRVHDVTDVDFDGGNSHAFRDIEVTGHARDWYIHLGQPDRCFCVELGLLLPDGGFHLIARSNTVRMPRDRVSDVVDSEWMTVEFDRLLAASAGPGPGRASEEMLELLQQGLELGLASGGISSLLGSLERQARARGFWLVADTELIVYGATEPDAHLTVQGRAVRLRPDGTFTLRFALPDGVQNIPIEAESADGVEVRAIKFVVSRTSQR